MVNIIKMWPGMPNIGNKKAPICQISTSTRKSFIKHIDVVSLMFDIWIVYPISQYSKFYEIWIAKSNYVNAKPHWPIWWDFLLCDLINNNFRSMYTSTFNFQGFQRYAKDDEEKKIWSTFERFLVVVVSAKFVVLSNTIQLWMDAPCSVSFVSFEKLNYLVI